jgi:hypothetical protein
MAASGESRSEVQSDAHNRRNHLNGAESGSKSQMVKFFTLSLAEADGEAGPGHGWGANPAVRGDDSKVQSLPPWGRSDGDACEFSTSRALAAALDEGPSRRGQGLGVRRLAIGRSSNTPFPGEFRYDLPKPNQLGEPQSTKHDPLRSALHSEHVCAPFVSCHRQPFFAHVSTRVARHASRRSSTSLA